MLMDTMLMFRVYMFNARARSTCAHVHLSKSIHGSGSQPHLPSLDLALPAIDLMTSTRSLRSKVVPEPAVRSAVALLAIPQVSPGGRTGRW